MPVAELLANCTSIPSANGTRCSTEYQPVVVAGIRHTCLLSVSLNRTSALMVV